VKANFTGADLSEAWVFGSASWHITTERTTQRNLKINDVGEPSITVDSLEAAQFLHLLLSNEQMRHVLDTITAKVVLILGRFSTERKQILDALRTELRNRNYLPVVFDFELPSNQTTMETVSTLSHMARFVIADITDAKSVLQELRGIVSSRPTLPVQPILLTSQKEPGMFDFFRMFPWVLETYMYKDLPTLLTAVDEHVIEPAERKANEQILRLKQFRAT
jgi:hypothetical protein